MDFLYRVLQPALFLIQLRLVLEGTAGTCVGFAHLFDSSVRAPVEYQLRRFVIWSRKSNLATDSSPLDWACALELLPGEPGSPALGMRTDGYYNLE